MVVGYHGVNGGTTDFGVTRLKPDGSLDATSFADTDFGGEDYPNAVALQGDGKIVVAGGTDSPPLRPGWPSRATTSTARSTRPSTAPAEDLWPRRSCPGAGPAGAAATARSSSPATATFRYRHRRRAAGLRRHVRHHVRRRRDVRDRLRPLRRRGGHGRGAAAGRHDRRRGRRGPSPRSMPTSRPSTAAGRRARHDVQLRRHGAPRLPARIEFAYAAALAPDGRIVLAGAKQLDDDIAVARLEGVTPPPAGGRRRPGQPPTARRRSCRASRRHGVASARAVLDGRAKRGTTLTLELSEPARVRFDALAVSTGRRVGTRCHKPTRANRKRERCTLRTRTGRLLPLAPRGPLEARVQWPSRPTGAPARPLHAARHTDGCRGQHGQPTGDRAPDRALSPEDS